MPSKCTGCGKIHPDTAEYLINGCDVCGSKFFFFVKEEELERAESEIEHLSPEDVKEIEQDIREIVSEEGEKLRPEDTVVLDIEAIRVVKPGTYLIDVVNLFNQRPIVVRVGPGKYEIELSTIMQKIKKKGEGAAQT